MLCEFITRCSAAGLGSPQRFHVPMTQEQIGDATGLTTVHVNRMIRTLVEEGFVHHASMIHGDQTDVLLEVCDFLDIEPIVVM